MKSFVKLIAAGLVLSSAAEAEDVLDVRASPAVDRLIVITNDAQVLVLVRDAANDLVLGSVCILILVDEQVAVALLHFVEHLGVGVEQANGPQQQVVEIE